MMVILADNIEFSKYPQQRIIMHKILSQTFDCLLKAHPKYSKFGLNRVKSWVHWCLKVSCIFDNNIQRKKAPAIILVKYKIGYNLVSVKNWIPIRTNILGLRILDFE